MNSIRLALAWSFLERYALLALNLVSYILIARLLTPEEIGIYSVTAALIGIGQVVRDFGIGNYLIQAPSLSGQRLETAYGIAVLAGFACLLLCNIAAAMIAQFYGDLRMVLVLRVLSLNFVLLSFCSVYLAMLRRLMRFDRLMAVGLTAGVVGVVVTLALAFFDTGPASLAWGTVAGNTVAAICGRLALPSQERPAHFQLTQWREVLQFGRQNTAAGVTVTVAMDINDLVVGKFLGFVPVATINRALGLMNLYHRELLGAARNVALPAFSEAHRRGQPVEPLFAYSFGIITASGWTFFGFLGLYPLEVVRLLLGPQWDATAPLVTLFAVAGGVLCLAPLTQQVMIAVGRLDLMVRAEIGTSLVRVILVSVTAVVTRDVFNVAVAFLASYIVSVPIFFVAKFLALPSDWRSILRLCGKSALVAAGALLIPALLSFSAGLERDHPMPAIEFALAVLSCALTWFGMLHLAKHPLSSDPVYMRFLARVRILPHRS